MVQSRGGGDLDVKAELLESIDEALGEACLVAAVEVLAAERSS
jgi:hypothetical protein